MTRAPAAGSRRADPSRPSRRSHAASALLLLVYCGLVLAPAWNEARSFAHAADFATYYYAVREAWEGGDPYDTSALERRSGVDGTRARVHPYLYPPPFLLAMLWALPLDLQTAYRVFFWANQLVLAGVFWVLWRWLRPPPLLLALLLVTFTPISDNAVMGQANLVVLLLAVVGLWRSNGLALGAAAMAKLSPALYLALWASQRRWRPVVAAGAAAGGLTVLALPLVGPGPQLRFYTEVVPDFSTGHYHGLTVAISSRGNHSIPELFNQAWPGQDEHALTPAARLAASATALLLLAGLIGLARPRRDALGEGCTAGAFTVLLLVAPVYTFEHHLVLLLLPLAALGAALFAGRLHRAWWAALPVAYGFAAWPLYGLRNAARAAPEWAWWLQESKLFALLLLGAACAAAARAAPRADAAPRSVRPASPSERPPAIRRSPH